MPSCFFKFPNWKVILDCTEKEVAVPYSLSKQKAVYSHYKQKHTFKVLVGVAPNGTITFVSDFHAGPISDKRT